MRVLIASDSYKGSLNSIQVAKCIKEGVLRVFPDADVVCDIVADGGEGTVDAIVTQMNGSYEYADVTGPNGDKVHAKYGFFSGDKAIIEMAAASGLPLIDPADKGVMDATTYGTGELIKAAIDKGCRELYVGLGGSATNDGGIGMAQAIGVSFQDKDGCEVGRGGKELSRIEKIDIYGLDKRILGTKMVVLSDVTNPLFGENGAAVVFGPQKGASPDQVKELDEGLKHFSEVLRRDLNIDVGGLKGAGAAGGLGAGLVAFTGAEICSGIETILDLIGFDRQLEQSDIVITGEGKIDEQSVCGKVITGICRDASAKKVPVFAISGAIGQNVRTLYQRGVGAMEAAACRPMKLAEAVNDAEILVPDAAERVMRAVKIGMNI